MIRTESCHYMFSFMQSPVALTITCGPVCDSRASRWIVGSSTSALCSMLRTAVFPPPVGPTSMTPWRTKIWLWSCLTWSIWLAQCWRPRSRIAMEIAFWNFKNKFSMIRSTSRWASLIFIDRISWIGKIIISKTMILIVYWSHWTKSSYYTSRVPESGVGGLMPGNKSAMMLSNNGTSSARNLGRLASRREWIRMNASCCSVRLEVLWSLGIDEIKNANCFTVSLSYGNWLCKINVNGLTFQT